jgi:hypothetical protein
MKHSSLLFTFDLLDSPKRLQDTQEFSSMPPYVTKEIEMNTAKSFWTKTKAIRLRGFSLFFTG